MSNWTDKDAIIRDLAEAQGSGVPADLEGIGANERPPALNIPEETGEEYFGPYEGEGDCVGPPDLELIQHMLDMVRDVTLSNCNSNADNSGEVLQITKPHNVNIGKDVTHSSTGTIPKKPVQKVKKRRDNVAINSLLQAMAGDTPISNMELPNDHFKLLKPTDFIAESSDKEIVESVQKVTGWLDNQVPSTMTRSTGNPLVFEPGTMFKRRSGSAEKSTGSSIKSSPSQKGGYANSGSNNPVMLNPSKGSGNAPMLEKGSMFKRKSNSSVKSHCSGSDKSVSPQKKDTSAIGMYQPSAKADEYYQKYVERSKMKELVQEDVWTKAERIMKEIDAKKKIEVETAETEALLLKLASEETAIAKAAIDTAVTDEINIDMEIAVEPTIDTSTANAIPIDTGSVDAAAEDTTLKVATVPDTAGFLSINDNSGPSQETTISGRDLVELPQHRHLLREECIVCKVVKAHGYDVDKEIYGNCP